MRAKTISAQGHTKAFQFLQDPSRVNRLETCLALSDFALSAELETLLCSLAECDAIADIRRAARKALLSHWGRSRGQGLKSESEKIARHLAASGIATLHHVTAKPNWESIQNAGRLLSRTELNKMRANVVFIADSLYDRDCGTSDWVHLCFHPNQPMFYQKISAKDREEFVVLDVSLEVALWDSAVFSDEYATATRARLGPRFSDLQKLNLECFASGMFTSTTKAAWQAEVLVHKSIPISAISRTRSYADVLKEHQSAVPAGAKMGFLSERAVGP